MQASIPGFPGYQADEDGAIWSFRSGVWRKLTPAKSGCYLSVRVPVAGKKVTVRVHILVLLAFVGQCPEGMEACHNDSNGCNNSRPNLRWDTRKNNHADKIKHGTTAKGMKNSQAILNESEVVSIKQRLLAGERATDIAGDYPQVSTATIFTIKRETNWGWLEPRLPEHVRRRRRYA